MNIEKKLQNRYYYNPTTTPAPTAKPGTCEFKLQRRAYNVAITALQVEFKADLFEDYGVTGNPKAERAYAIAQDNTSGYLELYEFFGELVDLIR
jgi:hypothetical protein